MKKIFIIWFIFSTLFFLSSCWNEIKDNEIINSWSISKNNIDKKVKISIKANLLYSPDGKEYSFITDKWIVKWWILISTWTTDSFKYWPVKWFTFDKLKKNWKLVVIQDWIESNDYINNSIPGLYYSSKWDLMFVAYKKEYWDEVFTKNLVEDNKYFDIVDDTFKIWKDGSYMYIANKRNGKYVLVKDWKESKEYIWISDYFYWLNWKDYFFIANDWWKNFLVKNWIKVNINDKYWDIIYYFENNYWKWESFLAFSKDEEEYVLVNNWKEIKRFNYDYIYNFKFIDNGSYIFLAKNFSDEKSFLVYNWKKNKEYDYIVEDSFKYFPQFNSYVFIWLLNWKYVLVKDWIELAYYDDILNDSFKYTDDWKTYYYIASNNNKYFLIKNWVELWLYDSIIELYDNSNKTGFSSIKFKYNNYFFVWEKDNNYFLVKNWKEIFSSNKWIGLLEFSPNWIDYIFSVWDWLFWHQLMKWNLKNNLIKEVELRIKTNFINIKKIDNSIDKKTDNNIISYFDNYNEFIKYNNWSDFHWWHKAAEEDELNNIRVFKKVLNFKLVNYSIEWFDNVNTYVFNYINDDWKKYIVTFYWDFSSWEDEIEWNIKFKHILNSKLKYVHFDNSDGKSIFDKIFISKYSKLYTFDKKDKNIKNNNSIINKNLKNVWIDYKNYDLWIKFSYPKLNFINWKYYDLKVSTDKNIIRLYSNKSEYWKITFYIDDVLDWNINDIITKYFWNECISDWMKLNNNWYYDINISWNPKSPWYWEWPICMINWKYKFYYDKSSKKTLYWFIWQEPQVKTWSLDTEVYSTDLKIIDSFKFINRYN